MLLYEELTREIIGAAIEVHRVLGPGFLESVYESALAKELAARKIHFKTQDRLKVMYKGESMGKFRTDILVENKVVIEIKALSHLTSEHTAQAIHYLTATRKKLALLINFGAPRIAVKRVIL